MASFTGEEFEKGFPRHSDVAEQIRYLLTGAVRAPSTHNSQPWKFKMRGNLLEVFRDESVQLPNSDKDTQYAHVSIGFLLHHIEVLGKYFGMAPRINVTAGAAPLASITFTPSTGLYNEQLRPLLAAICSRRNRRGIFRPESIPDSLLTELSVFPSELPAGLIPADLKVVTDHSILKRIGELTLETMTRVYESAPFRKEMSRWVVPTGSSRKDGIPGYSLNQPRVLSWILPHLIRTFNIGRIPGKQSAAAIASSAAAFAFGSESDPAQWISIGYAASRIILALTVRGFDASVFVATAELPDIRKEVTDLCGLAQPLRFLFVAGKLEGSAQWSTPRIPIEGKLIA